ncbi:glycosyltransferase involved in cell wall biosynthesis [Bosea sp. BE125]|uniref:glycosyltransferase family 2 protein n=1 Tax=Bosea sp. BE125 TaxID=2817909 RepID=UPI002862A4C4|nr:glycosyltransferase family 2 protein [Bosea sp. BE125]MDR6874161.1 glycosyltransferase involved in cell wall biosynthesis [Bosea sp. BE125]
MTQDKFQGATEASQPATIQEQYTRPTVAVIIPCFKVAAHIETVVRNLKDRVDHIFVVDDKCPQNSGQIIAKEFSGQNVTVIFHEVNQGVGGAMMTGYKAAAENYDILVKMDGDDQMDPLHLNELIAPVILKDADYAKGNRFHAPSFLNQMPKIRIFGNAMLSFLNKMSSGYWKLMDPTNGYTCLDAKVVNMLDFDKIDRRFFFESDMIFQLGLIRAVIVDVPIPARYGDEVSNLSARKVLLPFFRKHLTNFCSRFFYQYVLRDFNIATIWTLFGVLMFGFGVVLGSTYLVRAFATGEPTALGIIMMSAINVTIGLQFLLSALAYDINAEPSRAIARYLRQPPGAGR